MTIPLVKIGDICDLNPKLPKSHQLTDADEVSFVPMAAVSELSCAVETLSTKRFAEVRKGYTPFQNNDVLFAKITPCMENGKTAIARDLVGGYGFGSTEFHVLRAKDGVLPEWLHFFVRQASFRNEAKRNFTGTGGQQRVPTTFVANTLIPLPPLPEQRRIVDLLTRAEGIVRLRREAAAKAAELIPAIFIDMFGDPAMNPKGWPVVALGDLLAEPPTLGTMKKPTLEPQPWLDLRVANIQGGQLRLEDKKWLDLTPDEVARFELRTDDIILARAIGSLDHLGKAVVVNPDGPWTFDSHLMRVRVNQSRLLPKVLTTFLETASGRREFLSRTRRSAVQFNINGKELRLLRLPLPPIDLQAVFVRRFEEVSSIARQQSDGLTKAQATFNALLAQAVSPATSATSTQA
jgi:type I restriction enzyme S subunit